MIKEILESTNPKLRTKSKPAAVVDKKVKKIIKDLVDTLKAQIDPEGVGLAAPQIGEHLRIFVMETSAKIKPVINPEIVSLSAKKGASKNKVGKTIMEGCLSLPHFYGPIVRSKILKLKYLGEDGKPKVEDFKGLDAQIIQHEIDHLNGVLFIDRLLEQKKPLYEFKDGEWEKVEI